ncbi:DUF896 domain-containing protein [Virgibacillus sp. C22-A2]|uniref:DUF896 domain-containing protein n=1 Tax=Virgibacillus tibetensis TaxID=3042313 RepID=A0ABU6KGN1_9BACI|nr:DUF896 domain-containing protein [Virgibacillus sp. C22-A2]
MKFNRRKNRGRTQLRRKYLDEFRGKVLTTMTGLTIVNELGEDITPEKLVVEKANRD